MKRYLLLLAVMVLGFAGSAQADPACTAGTVVIGPGAVSSCTVAGLTFSGFGALNAFGAVPNVGIVINPTVVNGFLVLNFSMSPLGPGDDFFFFFTVTGGISGIDLSVGGTGAVIDEIACSSPIPTTGPDAFTCPGGNLLASVTGFSQGGNVIAFFPNGSLVNPVYIFKDIGVSADGGSLSTFNQSWHVPEPATLALFGMGLLGLAGVRRKISL